MEIFLLRKERDLVPINGKTSTYHVHKIDIELGEKMITIDTLTSAYFDSFKDLFCDYFIDDLHVKMERNRIKEKIVDDQIIQSFMENVIYVDIITEAKVMKGFIIYQIDSDRSDWNERLGDGFIREQFVCRDSRKKGYGTLLLLHAETILKAQKVTSVYLTANDEENAKAFYISQGYVSEQEKSAFNALDYYSKIL